MQIVIDIDENVYTRLFDNGEASLTDMLTACVAIRKGAPLPAKHGDLIDRKELMNAPYRKGGFVEWYDEIKYAPTIIPADKEESE